MNLQCLLYGHMWRHPGEFSIILSNEHGPIHPFACERCDSPGALQSIDGEWLSDLDVDDFSI